MSNFNLFVPIRKVDEAQRLVYGRLVQEVPDKAGEIFDFERSRPHFEKWISETQELSKGRAEGNMRAMHGKVAAGIFTEVLLNDEEKAVDVVGKVVDNNEWEKVLAGVYTGFSVGGSYGERWQDGDLKRYEAIPKEGSLVDRPCIPTATFFDIVKADGVVEQRSFQPAEEPVHLHSSVTALALIKSHGEDLGQQLMDAYSSEDLDKMDAVHLGRDEVLAKIAKRKDVDPGKGKSEYGDVTFADPKNKKYPIDTAAHVRAAWSYINQEKNASKYKAEDLKTIKDRIVSAWKSKIDKAGPPSTQSAEKVESDGDLKKYFGEEVWDAKTAMNALSDIMYLYTKELGEDHPEAPAQIADLKTVIERLRDFIASEIGEIDPGSIEVGKVDSPGERPLTKIGAKISAVNLKKLQLMHDHAVDLGATCKKEELAMSDGATDLQKLEEVQGKLTKLEESSARQGEVLQKVATALELGEKIDEIPERVESLKKRVTELEAEPSEAKSVTKVVTISKEMDNRMAKTIQVSDDELQKMSREDQMLALGAGMTSEEIAKLEPEAKAMALMKISLGNPVQRYGPSGVASK